jgi:GTPase SAR1 family protein
MPLKNELLQPQAPEYDHMFKVVFLGAPKSGASSVRRWLVDETYSTDVVSPQKYTYKTKLLDVEGKTAKLFLWDKPPADCLIKTCEGAKGFILTYDSSDPESFPYLLRAIKHIKEFGPPFPSVLFLRTKSELSIQAERELPAYGKEMQYNNNMVCALAAKQSWLFHEVSAAKKVGINGAIHELTREMLCRQKYSEVPDPVRHAALPMTIVKPLSSSWIKNNCPKLKVNSTFYDVVYTFTHYPEKSPLEMPVAEVGASAATDERVLPGATEEPPPRGDLSDPPTYEYMIWCEKYPDLAAKVSSLSIPATTFGRSGGTAAVKSEATEEGEKHDSCARS